MEFWERNKHIARIVAGEMRFRIEGKVLYLRTPSRFHKALAEEVFCEQLETAEASLLSSEEHVNFLAKHKFWTDVDEKWLEKVDKDIDTHKVLLFEKRLLKTDVVKIREQLSELKKIQTNLTQKKHRYDDKTPLGHAIIAKMRFLLGCSLFYNDNTPYWEDPEKGWDSSDAFLETIMHQINQQRLTDAQFRELARTEPWVSTWHLQKHCKQELFAFSAYDLTDDQKTLLTWSVIYENAIQHPDNLDQSIICDDDMLDGWRILKNKEHDKLTKQSLLETGNEKIDKSPEQFRFVKNQEEAEAVLNLNDEKALRTMNNKMKTIADRKEVSEQELPDVALQLQQQAMEKFRQRIKSKG